MSLGRDTARECLDAGLRAEHADELDDALLLYGDAAVHGLDDPAIIAEALTRQAAVYRRRSEWDMAVDHARRARAIAEDAEIDGLVAEALVAEGNALMCRGSFDSAVGVYERLLRMSDDDRQRGIAVQNLGSIHAQRGDLTLAREAFEESRELFRLAGYERGGAIALNNLGRVALDASSLEDAEELLQDALASARDVGDAELVALVHLNLGQLRLRLDDMDAAHALTRGALDHFIASGNGWRQIECWTVLGDLAARRANHAEARESYAKANALAQQVDARREGEILAARLGALGVAERPR